MHQQKILVADDSRTILTLVRRAPVSAGHDVIIASDGKEAVQLVRRDRSDLVILDVQMPVMDGYTACEQILEEQNGLEEIPIIFFTNDNARHLTGFSSQLGTYLQKPVPDEALLATIDVLLERNCCSTSEASF